MSKEGAEARARSTALPSYCGFRNVGPQLRTVRRAGLDKEALEKHRLKHRTGGYHRYEDVGRFPMSQAPDSVAYMSEADRFVTDTAGEERRLREQAAAKKAQELLRRREENAVREEARWARMAEEKAAEEERWRQLRDSGAKAQRNKGSTPYDPLTLKYHDNKDGLRLKHADDQVVYRAELRARNLLSRNRCVDYDLVTGAPKPMMPEPRKPAPLPEDIASKPLGSDHY